MLRYKKEQVRRTGKEKGRRKIIIIIEKKNYILCNSH